APRGAAARPRPQEIAHQRLSSGEVLGALDQELRGALGERHLAEEAHELLVPHSAVYSRGREHVLEVMDLDRIERGVDRLHGGSESRKRLDLRGADEIVLRDSADRVSAEFHAAAVVADAHVRMMILAVDHPRDRIHEGYRLVEVLE